MEYKVVTVPAEWKPAPRVCRCCLSEGCYKDISTEYYWLGEKEMYSQMLKECFDLTISLSEAAGSSRLICEVCITRLRDASNFKKQVINSEKRFAEHLRSGASLSVVEAQETPVILDIKVEGVKDEAAISDDDPDPVDDDIADPDYDESDDLPLKFEVQKKESMTELSFGDEIPALNTSETTIKKVSSKTKDKSALKKLKMNKRELTIKPVKASTSKKKDKVAKTKVKAAKPGAKKDEAEEMKMAASQTAYNSAHVCSKQVVESSRDKSPHRGRRIESKMNAATIIECSLVSPFRSVNNRYLCFYCPMSFFDPKELRAHTRTHPVERKVIYRRLPHHGRPVKVDVNVLDCRACGASARDFHELKEHLKTHHEKRFFGVADGILQFRLDKDVMHCVLCGERFHAFNMLNNHMNTHFEAYFCETCGRGFMSYPRLRTHRQSHNITDKYPCHLCGKDFTSKLKRAKHVTILHKRKRETRCPECGEAFRDPKQRVRHQEEVHGKSAQRHGCSACARQFRSKNALRVHVRRDHRHERPHACSACPRTFFSTQLLREHEARHRGDVFACEICSSSFKWKRSLARHMRMHGAARVT